jgi:hypothetical protein
MRHVRAIVGLLAVGLLFGGVLSGDEQTPPKTKGTLPAGWKSLGLSDQQKQTIYTISAKYKKQIAALRKQISDLQGKQKAEMLKVLTREQKEKLVGIDDDKPKDKPKKDSAKDKN